MNDHATPAGRQDPWGPWGPAVRHVLVAVAILGALALIILLRSLVLQVLAAIVLAAGLSPLADLLQRYRLPRPVSVLLVYVLFVLALVLFGFIVIPPLIAEIHQFAIAAPSYVEDLLERLQELQQQVPILPPLDQQLEEQLAALGEQLGEIASRALEVVSFLVGAISGLFSVFFILVVALYLVIDGARIREYFLSFLILDRRERVRLVTARMGRRMGYWFLGQLLLSTVVGVVTFIGLTIIGVPGALLLAVLAAIGEIIPIVGPILAAIPAVGVAALQSPLQGIITAVFYLVLQQIESYVLAPNIIGRAAKLHPLAVIIGLLVGGSLFGLPGALIAVPVVAALSPLLDELRQAEPAAQLELPPEVQASQPEAE